MKIAPHRNSPLRVNSQITFKNRLIVPPMASSTATAEGIATPKTISHYARLADSGASLVIAEYTYVHPSGRSEELQLGASSDLHIAGLTAIATAIKSKDAYAGLQLTHSGGKSNSQMTTGNLMGPSGIRVPVKNEELETPRTMTREDVDLWRSSFVSGADRAVVAGFDLVEFHAAHGYGFNQWLSPLTNQRSDQYGKDAASRFRLLGEVISAVRANHPRLLISVRIPGQDFYPGGLQLEDSIALAGRLEKIGVDLLHVSSGIGGWRRPSPRLGQGYLVPEAAAIQASVQIPVIGVGGIETGSYIDAALGGNQFALAAVGRAILKDPLGWRASEMNS